MSHERILSRLGLSPEQLNPGALEVVTPIDGTTIAIARNQYPAEVAHAIKCAHDAFAAGDRCPRRAAANWCACSATNYARAKADLGALVTLESGKILQEGLGEVQEMIDICDFAVGLSRQLYGLTMASERAGHSMRETWHPAGVCGIITAFNFPVAPWCWNAALALVCGDPVIWKPSEKTPLCALATQQIFDRAISRFGAAPPAIVTGRHRHRRCGGRAGRQSHGRDRFCDRLDSDGPRRCATRGGALRQGHL